MHTDLIGSRSTWARAAAALLFLVPLAARAGSEIEPATAPPAQSLAKPAEPHWTLGGTTGLLLPGTVTVGGLDIDTRIGVTARLHADYFVAPRFSAGAVLLTASMGTELDASVTVFGIGPQLTAHFGDLQAFHVRASLAVTYQAASAEHVNETSSGLGIPFAVDLVFPRGDWNLFAHAGFISQPSGGTSGVDVSWAPIFSLGLGGELVR